MALTLRRIPVPVEHSPTFAHLEDWQVLDDGKPVGRLYQRHTAAPPEVIWHWSITEYVEPRAGLRTRAPRKRSTPRKRRFGKAGTNGGVGRRKLDSTLTRADPTFGPCRCVCVRSRQRPSYQRRHRLEVSVLAQSDRCIMWKLTTITASIFLLAACDTTDSIKREQLERAKAEIEAYSEIDDAKCRNYGTPGSGAYDKCRTSATNARMNARGSGASK